MAKKSSGHGSAPKGADQRAILDALIGDALTPPPSAKSENPHRPPKPPKREKLTPDPDKIDDAVLALLLLGEHDQFGSVWKSFDWDAMDRLHAKGLISEPRGKAKSVVLTDEGRAEAERLFKELFARR
jgi:hypothetical protein